MELENWVGAKGEAGKGSDGASGLKPERQS